MSSNYIEIPDDSSEEALERIPSDFSEDFLFSELTIPDAISIPKFRAEAYARLEDLKKASTSFRGAIEDRVLKTYGIDMQSMDHLTKRKCALGYLAYDYAFVSLYDDRGELTLHGQYYETVMPLSNFRSTSLNTLGSEAYLKALLTSNGWNESAFRNNESAVVTLSKDNLYLPKDIVQQFVNYFGPSSVISVPGEISINYNKIEIKFSDNFIGVYGGENTKRTILLRVP